MLLRANRVNSHQLHAGERPLLVDGQIKDKQDKEKHNIHEIFGI